jgi:hypothetical protein
VPYLLLADAVVLVHFAFVVFVVLGGLLVLVWPRLAWVHVPAVLWGVAIEWGGWVCPLTPLESWLRAAGGAPGAAGGFVEHHVVPLLYPAALTRGAQVALGALVLLVNVPVYWVALGRRR